MMERRRLWHRRENRSLKRRVQIKKGERKTGVKQARKNKN